MLDSVSDMSTTDDIMPALSILIAESFAAIWRDMIEKSIVERRIKYLMETSRIMKTNYIDRIQTESDIDQFFLILFIWSNLDNLEKKMTEIINFNDSLVKLI